MISLKHDCVISSRKALTLQQDSANLPVPGEQTTAKRNPETEALEPCEAVFVPLLKHCLRGHQQVITNMKEPRLFYVSMQSCY